MKPMIVHNLAGEPKRISPLQIVGWDAAEHELGNGRFCVGTLIIMAGNVPPLPVRESLEQVDWLYERATANEAWPPLQRVDPRLAQDDDPLRDL